jgi:hypothetical protein
MMLSSGAIRPLDMEDVMRLLFVGVHVTPAYRGMSRPSECCKYVVRPTAVQRPTHEYWLGQYCLSAIGSRFNYPLSHAEFNSSMVKTTHSLYAIYMIGYCETLSEPAHARKFWITPCDHRGPGTVRAVR